MLAIIRTGGKQYLVSEGEKVKIESIEGEVGTPVTFETLYVGDDKEATVGTPVLEGAKVEGKIIAHDRHDKVTGIKYKPKKHYKVKFGHRQDYTEVEITNISTK
ncbi:MAG: 50S ribosomal protein L21 [Candidatus Moranbacteria bacterium]|nr:50S ribosomal protein L21 [Candidatus Moranbacteria bacterium]